MSDRSNTDVPDDIQDFLDWLAQVPLATLAEALRGMDERHPGEGNDVLAERFQKLADEQERNITER